ncbi:MAG: hypothetical protein ACYS76_06945 [Planctomycetota bacterium]|jgi:septation ring formation regulator EzrA
MKKQGELSSGKVVLRSALVLAIAAVSLGSAGCSDQLTAIEQTQFELQAMVQESSQQVVDNMATIRENQLGLQTGIEAADRKIAQNMAAIKQNQLGLREAIKERLEQMVDSIVAIEESQLELRGGIGGNFVQLSNHTAGIVAVEENLLKLRQMVEDLQNNAQSVSAKVTMIEESQFTLQQGIEDHIGQVITNVEAVDRSLFKLQQMLAEVQDNTQNVSSKVAAIEKNQLDLQDEIESSLRQVIQNIEAIGRLNESVFPAASSDNAISAEASLAAADVDIGE